MNRTLNEAFRSPIGGKGSGTVRYEVLIIKAFSAKTPASGEINDFERFTWNPTEPQEEIYLSISGFVKLAIMSSPHTLILLSASLVVIPREAQKKLRRQRQNQDSGPPIRMPR
jgi:hypothetical protein